MLALIRVPEEYREHADDIMARFQKTNSYDESLDPLVKSAYSKYEALSRRQMEHLLEITMNAFVIIMFLIISLILLDVKVKMELREMQKRYRFMMCFGMRQKERIRAEKKEISRFVWIPLAMTVCIVPVFTMIVFQVRGFSTEDMLQYGVRTGVISMVYFLLQILNLKILQRIIIRTVEDSIEK